jgi:glycerol-3-phosphate dehydrogenase
MAASQPTDHHPTTAPRISRDVDRAATSSHGLIVVGGGIYGVCVALEAARRGLHPLLVERDDFGGATSWSSLRIVHGGLRYLQKLDLYRFRQSIPERRWFQSVLPDLVRPLPCLMPLYGNGLRKPWIFQIALRLNDRLSRRRNDGLRDDVRLGPGEVIGPAEVCELVPAVDRTGLRGGALWHDAYMLSSERVLIELLRWACGSGAIALNYVEAVALRIAAGRVCGVEALDRESGQSIELQAPVVIACGGPWSRSLSARFDRERPELIEPSLAFNLLVDRPAIADVAVAVAPKRPGASTYFVLPWKGRILAGTCHLPWDGGLDPIGPTEEQLIGLLDDLNAAIPGLGVERRHVMRVYAGIVPAVAAGSNHTANRAIVVDHGATGGPQGLVSVSGVKYTTARLEAQRTLRIAMGGSLPPIDASVALSPPTDPGSRFLCLDDDTGPLPAAIARVIDEEAVLHVDDLLLRRMDLAVDGERALQLAAEVCDHPGWRGAPKPTELSRMAEITAGQAFGGAIAKVAPFSV